MISRALRNLVRERAGNCCEYCHLPQEFAPLVRFHVEHVLPKQHGGGDNANNLCLSCARCNLHKGPNLTGIDPDTGKIALLFNPRRQTWKRHFEWDGAILAGLTKTGRATIAVFAINHPQRIKLREKLLDQGEILD